MRSGNIIEIDPYEFVEASIEELAGKITRKVALPPLANDAAQHDFELRLWTKLGTMREAKLLVVRTTRDGDRAELFVIDSDVNAGAFHKTGPLESRSGWHKTRSELTNRLTTPRGLIRDPVFDLGRDEPVIFLQVLEKGASRNILYGHRTSFPDGKRLIEVCEYLAEEFGVDLSCR